MKRRVLNSPTALGESLAAAFTTEAQAAVARAEMSSVEPAAGVERQTAIYIVKTSVPKYNYGYFESAENTNSYSIEPDATPKTKIIKKKKNQQTKPIGEKS